jgi:3-phosphoshikimate 1-carboxyvinyltransferase
MREARISPGSVSGTVAAPASKSLSHRAIIAASLAHGSSLIEDLTYSADIEATLSALAAFGAGIERRDGSVLVTGTDGFALDSRGLGRTEDPGKSARDGDRDGGPNRAENDGSPLVIDCGESGSTLRFLIPLALASGRRTVFTGKGKLPERPLDPYFRLFEEKGIAYRSAASRSGSAGPGHLGPSLPLEISGSIPSGSYRLPGDVSSQFVSGLLFALPLAAGNSVIEIEGELESRSYVDLTISTLEDFGVAVEREGYLSFRVRGGQRYLGRNVRIEGDYSQASALLAAGLIAGEATVTGLEAGSVQPDRAFLDIARAMGGRIESVPGGFRARKSALSGIEVDVSQCPDIVPMIAVLGAFASGTTRITNAKRLRLKESDRLRAVASSLGSIGAVVRELEDSLVVSGGHPLSGGRAAGWNDHRIVMALAVAALAASGPVTVSGSEAVEKSYPEFFRDLSKLGADAHERNLG